MPLFTKQSTDHHMRTLSVATDTVAIRNGWIFSPRYDLLFFYLPFLLGWVILAISLYTGMGTLTLTGSSFVMLFALATFLDTGHVISTISQVYLDKEERAKYKKALIIAPICFFAIGLLIYGLLGMKYFLYFFGYFNFYHILKQQYGWMAYSSRKSGFFNAFDFKFDQVFVYAAMFLPFAWAHFSLGGNNTRTTILFFGNNPLMAKIFKDLFIFALILYLVKQVVFVMLYRTINFNKFFLLIITAVAWGAIIFVRSPFTLFTTSIMHSTPYMALIYFYGRKKQVINPDRKSFFGWKLAFILFPVTIFLAGYLYSHFLRYLAKSDFSKNLGTPFAILSILLSVAFFMHYYLDGIIWKKRNFKRELQ
jgi:hypothetical protein